MDTERFIEWETIVVRGNSVGVKKTVCPVCSPERKNKKETCLYVNFDSGVAKCFHCDRLSFKDGGEKSFKKDYILPSQDWKNYTNLSDKFVKWIWSDRMISQNTLQQFGITEELVYQPAKNKEMTSITFNYFEGEKLVNKKFRSAGKDFTQVKGGKPIFYNINSVVGAETVYIVEGEFDVLAMYEVGVKNCISLPNGANDNDDFWINSEQYLKDVKRFVIATDNDEKGIIVRDKIAQRLGRFRCTFIEWIGKDANDDLKSSKIESSLSDEKRFSIGGTFNTYDILDDTLRLYHEGMPKTIYPKGAMFQGMAGQFSIMMGQLTVITGIPSHGKSSFNDWYVLNLVKDFDYKASFYSPEHSPLSLYNSKFTQLAVGKPFFGQGRMSESDLFRYTEWSKEKLYFTMEEDERDNDWDWLLDKFKEQVYTYGINIFVVDAWNKVQLPKGVSGKEAIDRVLTKVTSFCIKYNVHVFLVAHPTKMKEDEKTGLYKVPTLYDVSGSADFKNQTHNGYTIYRMFETNEHSGYTNFINQKTKFSFQGEIGGVVKFNYHKANGRYYVDGSSPEGYDLTIDYDNQESVIKPSEDFLN
jgi:twinkle protein